MGGGERGVIRERSTKDFHVSGLDLGHTRETHSVFKNVVSAEPPPTWAEGDRNRKKWEKAIRLPKSYQQEIGWEELLSCQGEQPQRVRPTRAQESGTSTRSDVFSDLETKWNFHTGFQMLWRPVMSLCLLISLPFGLRIPILSHTWILEANNVFSSFTDPQLERNFSSGWIILRVSPIADSCDAEDKPWDFGLAVCRRDLGTELTLEWLEPLWAKGCMQGGCGLYGVRGQACSRLSGDPAKYIPSVTLRASEYIFIWKRVFVDMQRLLEWRDLLDYPGGP